MMMMMSAPSSSFHDYLATDSLLLKSESFSPIQTNEEHLEEYYTSINNNNDNNNSSNRNNRNSTVKRPMNAFLLWARGERKRLSSDGYGVSQTSLSKLLGETWRHMPVDEKQPFLDMAETLKRQHQIDHPDYRFKPKQRSTTANKTIVKKHHSPTSQRQSSTMMSSSSSFFLQQQQQQASSSSSLANATPHPIQPTVLAMCQAIIPTSSPSILSDNNHNNDDWFLKLLNQPQPVIVAPYPRTQTLSSSSSTTTISSRRAVRIQIINKHDDIPLPPPSLLPMTPSPLSSSSIVIDDSTPTLVDYLSNTSTIFNIHNNQQTLAPILEDITGYEPLQDSSSNNLMDLDQPYDGNGWIDTPLSTLGTNSADIISPTPYSTTYDFLCL